MKIIRTTSYFILSFALLFGSCKKKDTNDNTASTSQLDADVALIKGFFDENRKKSESFSLDAAIGGTIVTDDGTRINFSPNSFQDGNGNQVTGNVDIQVVEFNQPSEMVLGNKPTVSENGEILISAGEFFVTATSGGSLLQVRPQSTTVIIPVDTVNGRIDDMRIWSGDTVMMASLSGYDYQNVYQTVPVAYNMNPGVLWSDEGLVSSTATEYEMPLDSMGTWSNCDALYSITGPKTTLLCYFSIFNDSSQYVTSGIQPSMLFFKPSSINSIIKLSSFIFLPPAGYEGFLSYQNTMPVGESGDFLAITAKDGKLYAELKSNEMIPMPNSGATYTSISFNLQEVTEAQLLSMILSLD